MIELGRVRASVLVVASLSACHASHHEEDHALTPAYELPVDTRGCRLLALVPGDAGRISLVCSAPSGVEVLGSFTDAGTDWRPERLSLGSSFAYLSVRQVGGRGVLFLGLYEGAFAIPFEHGGPGSPKRSRSLVSMRERPRSIWDWGEARRTTLGSSSALSPIPISSRPAS